VLVTLISALAVGSISTTNANTLVVTAISEPTYVNDTVAVNVTVRNTGVNLANSTFLVFEDAPKEITINDGGAFDIAPNSYQVFTVKIAATIGASGNYDLKFHASSDNRTSETHTIPIQAGVAPVSVGKSPNVLPSFEVGFAVAALAIAAYTLSRRR
jgi:hypothetical protein